MRIIHAALIAATVIGSTFALGACSTYDDGYTSMSFGVSTYDDGYYYRPHHYWRHRYYGY